MLILGGRYGSIEEKSGLSYTELEYRYELSKDIPVFAVVLKGGENMAVSEMTDKELITTTIDSLYIIIFHQ